MIAVHVGRLAVRAFAVAYHPTKTEMKACQDRPVMEMLTGNGADSSVP
jgi:hypothetical protein